MPNTFEQMQKTFEIFVNKQAAELEAIRAVLQSLVVSMFANHPKGAELFDDLRTGTLTRLADEIKLAGSDQDAVRKAEFVHLRATQIFDEMAPVFGLSATDSPDTTN